MGNKKVIENKGLEYMVFEEEGAIEISVSIPKPFPGFDVRYLLNDKEKQQYKTLGIAALQDRMADMRKNYTQYNMISWR